MPELPDLTAYLEALAERALGRRLERLRLLSPFVLRSVDPPPAELERRELETLERLGKRIVFGFEGERFLVLHLMIAGRLQWKERDAKSAGRIALAAFDFENGTLWLTEAATKKRAAIHLVRGREALAAHDPGGIEPLAVDFAAFRGALGRENRTLKRALTDPRIVAGIGNAYSDEILHAARLSPFARTADLGEAEHQRLFQATRETLAIWIGKLRAERAGGFPAKVTAFRPEMAVHGRHGQPCPRCGGAVQRIVYAENEANYCPNCQTGGKLLADRVLSQLLKGDWPKTLEELEERKGRSREASAALRAGISVWLIVGIAAPRAAPAALADTGAAQSRPRQDVELTLPLPAREADPARLAAARVILGEAARDSRLGPFALVTDVADEELLVRAAKLAETLDVVYRDRYGLAPLGPPRESVVLFRRESDYRLFQRGERDIGEIAAAAGLAGGGIASTWVEGRLPEEVLATLTHEWTHLANRRALGPALPSWLDEGIAEDLGASRVDAQGRLVPGTWSRVLTPLASGWTIAGGEAALRDLYVHFSLPASAAGELERTLKLDWRGFSGDAGAAQRYGLAAAFLRLLLADRELGARTRAWLAEVATGASPEAEELREALGLTWDDLETRLRAFVTGQFALLDPLPKPVRIVHPE
jgi:formamidopyrimidine-DNA glycosylase